VDRLRLTSPVGSLQRDKVSLKRTDRAAGRVGDIMFVNFPDSVHPCLERFL
jgi:hypothetical protein